MYVNNVGYYIRNIDFSLFELLDRYQTKEFIFPDLPVTPSKKADLARKSIEALLYGIPYPQVYVSELQNGQYLVLETNNSLKSLIEFLSGKSKIEMIGLSFGNRIEDNSYYEGQQLSFYDFFGKERQDILRSKIQLSILEYELPLYAHLKIGAYVEQWKANQEEVVRRILYAGKGFDIIQDALKINHKTQTGLYTEFGFITFLTYVYLNFNPIWFDSRYDWYFLQDKMISDCKNSSLIVNIADVFLQAYKALETNDNYKRSERIEVKQFERKFPQFSPCIGHLLGMAACSSCEIVDANELAKIANIILKTTISPYNTSPIVKKIKNSDLSSSSIKQIINELKGINKW